MSIQQLADRKVLERFGPPGILVDERSRSSHFRGQTGPYLARLPGTATLNVTEARRPELLVALRVALQKVKNEGSPRSPRRRSARRRCDRPWSSRSFRWRTRGRKLLLVLFRDLLAAAVPPPAGQRAPARRAATTRTEELDRELRATKEYLQTTSRISKASNEELQSSNEELQSSNEELQSTNEELETSKEELQSTNEELGTVNDELQSRMSQLAVSNDDVQNVLAVVTMPVVLVGHGFPYPPLLRRTAERLLNLIPGDVGRPVTYLRNVLSTRDIEQLASEAMETVTSREQRVRGIDGFWYMMKMMPLPDGGPAPSAVWCRALSGRRRRSRSDRSRCRLLLSTRRLALVPLLCSWIASSTSSGRTAHFFELLGGPGAWGGPSPRHGATTEPAGALGLSGRAARGRAPRDVLLEHPFGRPAAAHPLLRPHRALRGRAGHAPSRRDARRVSLPVFPGLPGELTTANSWA